MPPLTSRKPAADSAAREPLRVGDDLPLVLRNSGSIASLKQTALAAMMCISGPPCTPGNTARSRSFAYCARHRTMPAARPAQCLVRRRRDEIGVRHRARVHAGGDEPGDVRHVGDHRRADRRGHLADALEVDDARIGARADHDHLRLVLVRQPLQLVVVDPLVVLPHAVRDDVKCLPEKFSGWPCVRWPPCERFIPRMVSPGLSSVK